MKIVSYMHNMRIWILDDGLSIPVDAYPDFRVGQELRYENGEYTLATQAAECET